MKNVRWYNPRINKHSWENPDDLSDWKPVYSDESECLCKIAGTKK